MKNYYLCTNELCNNKGCEVEGPISTKKDPVKCNCCGKEMKLNRTVFSSAQEKAFIAGVTGALMGAAIAGSGGAIVGGLIGIISGSTLNSENNENKW
ncbi:MAG: hypothetical protein WC376_02675 [Candidatus Nanoarchaeia archaeon]|jgi:hypothetical protein